MLQAPERTYGPNTSSARAASGRSPAALPSRPRDLGDDFARPDVEGSRDAAPRRVRFTGLRFRLRGGVPQSIAARLIASSVVLAGLAGFTAVLWEARSLLLHDPRLIIRSSSSIQIFGNQHLTRPQLLSVFGEDVARNILTVSLEDRRAELEQLPWVEHATVMRLLPNRLRVSIVERTPIAFVRRGSHIGLVDRSGVLLDISPDAPSDTHFSFPILTGISAEDPASTRAARMALYERFIAELDAGKDKVSPTLSEVDLSSPEDVKALLPSGVGPQASAILVHFGEDDFLRRYQRFQERLPEWKTQYPRLASVDMRYERQVVLEMAPGASVPPESGSSRADAPAKPLAGAGARQAALRRAAKPGAHASAAAHAPAKKKANSAAGYRNSIQAAPR